MQSYPYIPPLSTREVKELLRQIRVLRGDYPSLSEDELAAEWAEQQQWLLSAGKASPFAEWLGTDWRAGFSRALAFAERQRAQKRQVKAMRQKAKEYRLDRQPATPRQQRYVKRLAKDRDFNFTVPPESMSKLAASRLIQQLVDTPTPPLTENP